MLDRLRNVFRDDSRNPNPRQVSILKILPEVGSDNHPMKANEFKRKADRELHISGNTAYQKMMEMVPEYVEKIGNKNNGYSYYSKKPEDIYSVDEEKKARNISLIFLTISLVFMSYSGYTGFGLAFVSSSIFALLSVISLLFCL
jgi:hypothetical protein